MIFDRLHRVLLLLVAAMLAPAAALAQESRFGFDVSFGMNSAARRTAIAVWPIRAGGGALRFGIGVRSSLYTGDPALYANRDAITGNLADSVAIDPVVYAIDAAVLAEWRLGAVAIGANLDLVGVAGGPEFVTGTLSAKPQNISYFTFGAGDHGALNSEFYVALRVSSVVRIRGGLSHYVTNYEVTDTAVAGGPVARYQRFETVPFVAVSLQL